MIKPLIWMFKTESFKKHFLYLLLTGLLLVLLTPLIIFVLARFFISELNYNIVLIVIAFILMLPFLLYSGYFWCLTENIINRKTDITANSLYDGKIKEECVIELPELKFRRFIWRGIASVAATFVLYIPFMYVFGYLAVTMSDVSEFWGWTSEITNIFAVFFVGLVSLIIPALLWNYARRDSIFAVWNVPVAVRIVGSYTFRYLKNAFLFLLYSILYSSILYIIIVLLGINAADLSAIKSFNSITDINIFSVILIIVNYIAGIYWLYVNAYLLGTIAPVCES